jgi:tetratricopeptide (TPR) repeat protein
MAELFFERGSIFKFQSKYFTLCKNELGLKISEDETNSEDCKSIIDFIIRANGNLPIINDSEINDDHLYGIKSFRAKDFKNSVNFFTSALGKNFNSETLNYLGRSLEEIGNQKHAIIIFKQAIQSNPDHEYAGTNLAYSLFKSGNLDEAIVLKDKLLSKKNLNEWCINRLALIETDIPKKEVDEGTLDFLESDMPEEGNKEGIPNFLDFDMSEEENMKDTPDFLDFIE